MRLNLPSQVAAICRALTATPKIVLLGQSLRVSPGHQDTSTNPEDAPTQPTPAAGVPSSVYGHGWATSSRLQRLATGWCARQLTRLQSQVRKGLLDQRLFQDHRNTSSARHRSRTVHCRRNVQWFAEHPTNQTIQKRSLPSTRFWPRRDRGFNRRERSFKCLAGDQSRDGPPSHESNKTTPNALWRWGSNRSCGLPCLSGV